jgi:light-regulated signal transduction histidine kinase (bacteriophytochrome)
MNMVLAGVMQNLSLAVEESGTVITSASLPVVAGPEVHLVQLLQNLIGNAIKYRGPSEPRIEISVRQQGSEWLFAVKDNGMGIAPEYQQKIFGVFTRLHGKSIPGTGIGLAICQRVVQRHGGRIWVESELGQGATFYFTLPVTV